MKKLKNLMDKPWFSNTIAICVGVILYMILKNFASVKLFFDGIMKVLSPIIGGLIMAYLIDPVAVFFENKILKKWKHQKTRRGISVLFSILVLLGIIALFFRLVIPSLIESANMIYENRNMYAEQIDKLILIINSWNMGLHINLGDLTGELTRLLNYVVNYFADNMEHVISVSQNVGSAVINLGIGFILCIYFLIGKKKLIRGLHKLRRALLGEEKLRSHNTFWTRCHRILIRYITCAFCDALLVGSTCGIVMTILQMPSVALVAVIMGVANLVPTFGPMVGFTLGSIILLLNKPIYALWFAIMFVIIMILDAYVFQPRMFGDALGIPPIWILISIILGGNLFGAAGILLAIPFAAIATFLYQESLLPWLERRRIRKHGVNPPEESQPEQSQIEQSKTEQGQAETSTTEDN